MTQSNNEIDIIKLIILTFQFIKRKIKIITIFLLISIIIGGIGYWQTPKKYLNSLIVTTHLKTLRANNVYIVDIQPLYSILHKISENSKNFGFVKNTLGIEPNKIESIQIEILKDKNIVAAEPQNIVITVKTTDTTIFKQLEKNIINYCKKNEYLKKLENTQKKLFLKKSIQYQKYVKAVDSLFFNSQNNCNSIIVDFTRLTESGDILINNDTSIFSSIQIVNSFSIYPKTQNKKVAFGFIYFLVTFAILFTVLIITEIIKNENNK